MHRDRRHLFLSLAAWVALGAPAVAGDDPDPDDDVTVEGRTDRRDAAAAVTVITVDERLPEGSDVGDAVARSPGASVRRLGGLGGFAAVSLRGSALRQVEVHLDGIPLNPDGSASVNLGELPLRSLDRVEVWRGGGPPWLAAAPMGGIVNLVTRAGSTTPSLSVGFGSWGSLTGGASATVDDGPTQVLGFVSGLRTAGDFQYFDDNGTDGVLTDDRRRRRASNDKSQLSALLRVRRRLDRGSATALVLGTAREEGLPGPIGSDGDGRLATTWAMGAVDRDLSLGATGLRARIWGQARDEVLRAPVDEGGAATIERQGRVGLHAEARHLLTDTTALGVTTRIRHDVRLVPGRESGDATRWTATASADAVVKPIEHLRIEPVLHQQIWLDRFDGTDRVRALFNPRVAAAWTASERWVVRAGVGRAARAPDFLELFGDRGAVVGRPDLKPERGTWADLGVRALGRHGDVELGVFHHVAVDRIVFVQNGQRTLVPVNIGRSRVSGVEVGADLAATDWIDARLAATGTHSLVRSDVAGLDRKRLPRVPIASATVDLGLRWRDRARLGWALDAVAGNAWDEANRTVAAPRVLHGIALRIRPTTAWPAVTLDVRNLLDTQVQAMPLDPARPEGARVLRPTTDFAGYPLPGRTAMLTLRWTPDELAR